MNIIIAGSRTFKYYPHLKQNMDYIIEKYKLDVSQAQIDVLVIFIKDNIDFQLRNQKNWGNEYAKEAQI